MRFNPITGDAAMGVGNGLVSINGRFIGFGGEIGWVDDHTLVYARGNELRAWDTIHEFGSEVDPEGANRVRAGGGVWAAWLNGEIRTSLGWNVIFGMRLCDVDEQGTIITCPESLHGLTFQSKDGLSTYSFATGELGDTTYGINVRQREGALLFQENGEWTLCVDRQMDPDFRRFRLPGPCYVAVPVWINSELWILEQGERLTLRPVHSTSGYVIQTAGEPVYNPDAVSLTDDIIRVGWSRSIGEAPADLVVQEWDTRGPRVELLPHMPPVEDIPRLNREFGWEFYSFHDAGSPGHLVMPVRPSTNFWDTDGDWLVCPSDRPEFAGDAHLWAIYAPEGFITQARNLGNLTHRGIVHYIDTFPMDLTILPSVQAHDIVSCVFQRHPREDIGVFYYRCAQEYSRVAGALPQGAQFWPTFNAVGEAHFVAEAFVEMANLANDQHWPGMRVFAAGRADVPTAELTPYFVRFASGITAMPPPRVIPQEESMSVAVGPVMRDFIVGEVIPHGDGGQWVRVKLNNNLILCVTPDGVRETRPPETNGPWERFRRNGNALIAERDLNNVPVVYVLSVV